jgi:hypothetical protein
LQRRTKRIPTEILEMLSAQPLFSGLSQKELRSIVALGTSVDIKTGHVLTEEGVYGRDALLIGPRRAGTTAVRCALREP